MTKRKPPFFFTFKRPFKVAYFSIAHSFRRYFNSSNEVELSVQLVIFVKNLMLKLLTERNKVFYDILSVRPALHFRTKRDTKSFFLAQPIFLGINTIEEFWRVLLCTSLPVLTCDPKVEQEVKKCSTFTHKLNTKIGHL